MPVSRKVSIVEDDITMRNLLQTLLQLEGFNVAIHPPTSIEDIVKQIHHEKPDAVLLDVHLKNISGLDIVRQLKKKSFFHPLVVMASGMDLEVECKKAGADHFFLKPYMPDTLIAWLNENLI